MPGSIRHIILINVILMKFFKRNSKAKSSWKIFKFNGVQKPTELFLCQRKTPQVSEIGYIKQFEKQPTYTILKPNANI